MTATFLGTNPPLVTNNALSELAGSSALRSSARSNIGLSGFTRRNRFLNGAMQIAQLRGTNSVAAVNGSVPDGWKFLTSGVTFSGQVVASVTPNGSARRFRATCTTAKATLAAGDYAYFQQSIEGYAVEDFAYGTAAARVTGLSFGANIPAGFTLHASITNTLANRSYVQLFASVAGDYNYTMTPPGDTAGTWNKTSGAGIIFRLAICAGSSYQGASGWQAGNYLATSAQSNGATTAGTTFDIFDLNWDLGPDIYSFTQPDFRTEYQRCRVFIFSTYDLGVIPGTTNSPAGAVGHIVEATNNYPSIQVPVSPPMSGVPSYIVYNPVTGAGSIRGGGSDFAAQILNGGQNGVTIGVNGFSVGAATTIYAHVVGNSEL